MTILMKGKPVVDEMLKGMKTRVKRVVIFTNEEDEASKIYVKNKVKKFESVGIKCETFPTNGKTKEEIILIKNELKAEKIPYMFQLPTSEKWVEELSETIPYELDIDSLGVEARGNFYSKPNRWNTPCTPLGIYHMLKYYIPSDKLYNKNVVVIGRSAIVGRPIARVMEYYFNSTVTICHSKTQDLSFFTKNADIIIVAVGKPKFLKPSMIKEGAILIDVGINKDQGGKIYGDIDFEGCSPKSYAITPVPGGVGVTTVGSLVFKEELL